MLILGVDPGTATTGYGVIKIEKNGEYEVLKFGLIQTDKNGSPGKRFIKIHKKIGELLTEFKPDVMAIERLFFATNVKTAMRVGQAHGVMLLCAAEKNTEVFEYAPGTIKKVVTGNGRADKREIQRNVRKLLGAGVRSRPKKRTHFDNAADALAVALCHSLKGKKNQKEVI